MWSLLSPLVCIQVSQPYITHSIKIYSTTPLPIFSNKTNCQNLIMDSTSDVLFDSPYFRLYKGGRIDRFIGTDYSPAGVDEATGVTSKDVVIDTNTNLSVRLYLPAANTTNSEDKKLPVLVYFHGGGFLLEHAVSPTYHNYVNSVTAKAGVLAVSVEYRLAPEHPVPAAYEDSWTALQWVASGQDEWLAEHGDLNKLFLAGDSAGANIVHAMAMHASARGPKIEGAILLHPWFGGREGVEAEPELSRETTAKLWALVCPGAVDGSDDPRMNPIGPNGQGLEGLGCERVLVCVAERDGLKARGRAYYEAVKASKWAGSVEWFESEGEEQDHVFFLKFPSSDKAKELMDRVVAFLTGR